MATVTGLTAARMIEIENASVVDGEVDGSGHLILTTHGGSTIDAGNVKGDPGEDGSDATVPDASETVKGKVELATDAETITGTDDTRAVTPKNLKAVLGPSYHYCGTLYFYTSDTFEKADYAPWLRAIRVRLVGAGGAGGADAADNGAGGGGAGGYAEAFITDIAGLSSSVAVTIGAGGTGVNGTATAGIGNDGGSTSFGSLVVATGGIGGSYVKGGTGGIGTAGDFLVRGGGGAFGSRNWSSTSVAGGNGGSSLLGGGVAGEGPINGSPANTPQGGYGGGGRGKASGSVETASLHNGLPGLCIVELYS